MLQSNYEHLKKKFWIYNRNHEHFLKNSKVFKLDLFLGSILTWIRIRKHSDSDPDPKGAESESESVW